ncbi:MAG: GNAT family N-acetyltransferase [Lachnospiraceae bacterium]
MIQREIPEKKKGYVIIDRCREQDFDRTVTRLVHQCYRNGAREIFIADRETGKNRLKPGQRYGYYCLEEGYQLLQMEKDLILETDNGKTSELQLVPLKQSDWLQWISMYHACFFELSGSATYDETDIKNEQAEGSQFFWLMKGEERVGFAVLIEKKEGLFIDMLGIEKSRQGQGLGRQAISAMEEAAAFSHFSHLELMVASTNQPAISLYQSCGFQISGEGIPFFRARDSWQNEEGE